MIMIMIIVVIVIAIMIGWSMSGCVFLRAVAETLLTYSVFPSKTSTLHYVYIYIYIHISIIISIIYIYIYSSTCTYIYIYIYIYIYTHRLTPITDAKASPLPVTREAQEASRATGTAERGCDSAGSREGVCPALMGSCRGSLRQSASNEAQLRQPQQPRQPRQPLQPQKP